MALTLSGLLSLPASTLAQSGETIPSTIQDDRPIGPLAALFDRWRHPEPELLTVPLAQGTLSSRFGMRLNPILGIWTLHEGVDWSAPWGTAIYAAGDGVVVSAGWESGYGYTTRILHQGGVETTYAHQSRIAEGLIAGIEVHQGDVIGLVGATGQATGPHLHYEVRINGNLVDPLGVELQQAGLVAAF